MIFRCENMKKISEIKPETKQQQQQLKDSLMNCPIALGDRLGFRCSLSLFLIYKLCFTSSFGKNSAYFSLSLSFSLSQVFARIILIKSRRQRPLNSFFLFLFLAFSLSLYFPTIVFSTSLSLSFSFSLFLLQPLTNE